MSEERPLSEWLNDLAGRAQQRERTKEAFERERARLDKAMGTAMRGARERAGLSQSSVAAAMGVSTPYLSKIENGHGASTAQVEAIADTIARLSSGPPGGGTSTTGGQDV